MSEENSADTLTNIMPWRIKRYYFFVAATILAFVLPWIQIGGNHFFLLSFNHLDLHLAFIKFDMQEMYLMPFILMIMFMGIFGMTVMGGRVFCGWVCPQTIFRIIYRDLIETKILGLRKRIKNKQLEPDYSKPENQIKRVVAIVIWTALSFVATANFLWYFVPPEDFFVYLMDPSEHMIMVGTLVITALFLVADIVFIKENWCVYVCPYSRVQSVLYDDDTVMAIYNPHRGGQIYNEAKEKLFTNQQDLLAADETAECTACESCVTVCPTHIDIRKGLQLECINCLECVDACTTVMGKLGKPSLVQWSSDRETIHREGKTRYFRQKIIWYIVILAMLAVSLAVMGYQKEQMLLNINKENRLYDAQRLDDGRVKVDNAYIFLLQNTLDVDHDYYFDVIAPPGMEGKIKIAKPSEPFRARPGMKKKKIVILYTDELLVENERKDTVIPLTIRAYAMDDKVNIMVERRSTFTYPRLDVIRNAK